MVQNYIKRYYIINYYKKVSCKLTTFPVLFFLALKGRKNTARHSHPHTLFFFYESKTKTNYSKLIPTHSSPPSVSNQISSLNQSSNCPQRFTNAPIFLCKTIYNSIFHVNLIDLALLFNLWRFWNLGSKKTSILGCGYYCCCCWGWD